MRRVLEIKRMFILHCITSLFYNFDLSAYCFFPCEINKTCYGSCTEYKKFTFCNAVFVNLIGFRHILLTGA